MAPTVEVMVVRTGAADHDRCARSDAHGNARSGDAHGNARRRNDDGGIAPAMAPEIAMPANAAAGGCVRGGHRRDARDGENQNCEKLFHGVPIFKRLNTGFAMVLTDRA